jgi:hypothetical protein
MIRPVPGVSGLFSHIVVLGESIELRNYSRSTSLLVIPTAAVNIPGKKERPPGTPKTIITVHE